MTPEKETGCKKMATGCKKIITGCKKMVTGFKKIITGLARHSEQASLFIIEVGLFLTIC
jgi:hypothetical protein